MTTAPPVFDAADPEQNPPIDLSTATGVVVGGTTYFFKTPALELNIHVRVVRVKRRRCPRCQRVRVLFRLSAFGSSPIGDGPLLCGQCGGLR